MTRTRTLILMIGFGCLATGCLRKDTTQTLYIGTDGAARWMVAEAEVYSDDADIGTRLAEEQAYIGAALIGTQPVALAFAALKPDSIVKTTVLRDERPFHVVTEARFNAVENVLQRLFTDAGLHATVVLKNAETRSTLGMRFDFSKAVADRDSAATVLFESIDELRFVIAEGTFVAGGGFDVEDRRRATISPEWMAAAERALEERRPIELSLTWER